MQDGIVLSNACVDDALSERAAELCALVQTLREDGIVPTQTRLHERTGMTRSAVSRVCADLVERGLLASVVPLTFTPTGLVVAERTLRRRRLAARLLHDVLGVRYAACDAEARPYQHALSDEVENLAIRLLGHPATCPYGNPIPYEARTDPHQLPTGFLPLAEVKAGTTVRLARVRATLVQAPGALDFLESAGLRPGTVCTVTSTAPDLTVMLAVGDHNVGLGPAFTEHLVVVGIDG